MTRILQLVGVGLVATLAWSCSSSQPAEAPAEPATASVAPAENVPEVITGLEREWVGAILAQDSATIERLLDDEFIGTTDDLRYAKFDAILDVTQGVHDALALSDIQVNVFGDVAIATMNQTETSRHGDEDFSGEHLFTDVWVKRDGQWRVVASHGSRMR